MNADIGAALARFDHNLTLSAGSSIGINNPIYLNNNTLSATAPAIALDGLVDVGTGTTQLKSTGTVTQSAPITAPSNIRLGLPMKGKKSDSATASRRSIICLGIGSSEKRVFCGERKERRFLY